MSGTSSKSINLVLSFVEGLSFDEVSLKSTISPFNFSVSEWGNLYMLNFTEKSDLNLPLVRSMNGVIFEKETNKLVHYSFQKAYEGIYDTNTEDFDNYYKDYYKNELPEEYTIELSTKGSHIKVYWYNNTWNIGTSKNIEASIQKWKDSISFKEMFYQCLGDEKDLVLDSLDKNSCYSFVIQHQLNTGINSFYYHMLNCVNLQTFEITRTTIDFTVEKTLQQALEDSKINKTQYIVYLKNEQRIKINPLKNNNNKKTKLKMLCNHLKNVYFYQEIDYKIQLAVKNIHETYVNFYVYKIYDYDVYYKYEKSLKQLHYLYRKTRERITEKTVLDLILNLPEKVIFWLIDL
jgi:hypothetical protein